jgi:hypothetical protein
MQQTLSLIIQLVDELKLQIIRSRLTINEHCADLARQVDIVIETRIEELTNTRKQWLNEIKEYETECVQSMEATRCTLLEDIDRVKHWTDDAALKSSNFTLPENDSYLSELNQQALSHLWRLKSLRLEMKCFQFGARLMTYDK